VKLNINTKKGFFDMTIIKILNLDKKLKLYKELEKHLYSSLKLSETLDFSELFNIILTILIIYQNFETCSPKLSEIEELCRKIYTELHPKEMGKLLN
jgi:hypothetical protein